MVYEALSPVRPANEPKMVDFDILVAAFRTRLKREIVAAGRALPAFHRYASLPVHFLTSLAVPASRLDLPGKVLLSGANLLIFTDVGNESFAAK